MTMALEGVCVSPVRFLNHVTVGYWKPGEQGVRFCGDRGPGWEVRSRGVHLPTGRAQMELCHTARE